MATVKGGAFLINLETKKVALIYRKSKDDYSFPKGHIEPGEDCKEAAIRETIEETYRSIELLREEPIFCNKYQTSSGEDVECYFYLAKDCGPYEGFIDEKDREICQWYELDEVRGILSYDDLIEMWDEVLPIIKEYI